MAQKLEYISHQTTSKPSYALIWLHGLGASGDDFESLYTILNWPSSLGIRFILPHAPFINVTINGGMPMRAWFDLKSLDIKTAFDEIPFLDQSSALVIDLIENCTKSGIPLNRVLLGGFSQGAALALHTALKLNKDLAGVAILAGFLADQNIFKTKAADKIIKPSDTPFFIGHGLFDPVVDFKLGQKVASFLDTIGYQTKFCTYKLQHQVSIEVLEDLQNWILNCFKQN